MTGHLSDAQLSRLIDGDLSLTSREAVMAHLRSCPGCAERHDQLVAVAATLRLEPPLTWTDEATSSVLRRLPRQSHRLRVLAAGVVSLVMCGLVLVEAAPLIAAPLAVVGVLLGLGAALTPPALTASGSHVLVVVTMIAVLAPLAAYPLARWR